MISVIMAACENTGEPPSHAVPLFAGDSSSAAIVRAQAGQRIYCIDSAFDDYVCMTYDDHERQIRTLIDGCAVWKSAAEDNIIRLNNCLSEDSKSEIKKCLK